MAKIKYDCSAKEDFANRFKATLSRHTVDNASKWAEKYRYLSGDFPGLWKFDRHPWLRELHNSKAEFNVGQKAAQMGYSEAMLNVAFYTLDILKRNVLYILPNARPDATDFTNRAFTPAIEDSPHLKSIFSSTDNVGHKVVGSSNLYIRGSNSRAGLKSVPASLLIFDEYAEHNQDHVSLAEERSSGQLYRQNWKISTPLTPETDINHLFLKSTQERYFFPCPSCSKMIRLTLENLVIPTDNPDDDAKILESHLVCLECKSKIPHEAKPEIFKKATWVPEHHQMMARGFHISQLYSTVLPPYALARAALNARTDVAAEQELHNSKLGEPHIVGSLQLSDESIRVLIKDYEMVEAMPQHYLTTMGVDVGKLLHVEIATWDISKANPVDINAKAIPKVVWVGTLKDFEQLDTLMQDYHIRFCVIDALPESREAYKFAMRFWGRVRLCRYNENATAKSLFADAEVHVSVNRTSWLDESLGRFRAGTIFLPRNLHPDYIPQIKCPIRVPKKDVKGNLIYRYVSKASINDHFAHARNYNEIALSFATGSRIYTGMKEEV
jgi:hypothetical protein